jgi:hypothetical protein
MASGVADSQPQGLPGAFHSLVEGKTTLRVNGLLVNPATVGGFGQGQWNYGECYDVSP